MYKFNCFQNVKKLNLILISRDKLGIMDSYMNGIMSMTIEADYIPIPDCFPAPLIRGVSTGDVDCFPAPLIRGVTTGDVDWDQQCYYLKHKKQHQLHL